MHRFIRYVHKIRESVGITRENRKKSFNLESSSQLFLTELGSLGVHDTQKQVEFVERHEGKTRRSRFVVGWAEWHLEVDVNKHGRIGTGEEEKEKEEKEEEEEEWGIGRYGKLLSGERSAHENQAEEKASRAVQFRTKSKDSSLHVLRNLHLCPRDIFPLISPHLRPCR